jgi:hypothetical protein
MTCKDRLIELIKDSSQYMKEQKGLVEHIADYLIENGVIVPPCKVGDYVKWNNGLEIQLKEVFGFHYIPTDYGLRFILKDCSPIIKHDAIEGILTKEEAEQKLKGGADNE